MSSTDNMRRWLAENGLGDTKETKESLGKDLEETFNKEIARELMLEVNPSVTDADVEFVYSACRPNPWDAGVLYSLLLKSGGMKKC